MNLIERYIFGRAAKLTVVTLVAATFVVLITQILVRINLLTTSGQSLATVGKLALSLIPSMILITLPFAVLIGVWTIGASFVLLRWLVAWRAVDRISRAARPAPGASPDAWITDEDIEPSAARVFQPVVLLPAALLGKLTAPQLEAGIAPSIGTVGDALDNALMESTIALYKTELIEHDRTRSWTGRAEVERETASWVHWYNTTRIHHSIGKTSPIEYEQHYRATNPANLDEVA